jgi:hypothetical protein
VDYASVSPAVGVTVTAGTNITPYIYTFAGDGLDNFSGDGGPAINAGVSLPSGLCVDRTGHVFVGNGPQGQDNHVRMIDQATGIITTVAGNGIAGYSGDGGPATSAALNNPFDVAVDSKGNLFIADAWNACIRRVDAKSQIITTVAGVCGSLGLSGDAGPATKAKFILPVGLAFDAADNLYVAGDEQVRKVDASTGIINRVAGTFGGGIVPSGDGGPATSAVITGPYGLAVDSANNLYIVDWNAAQIRKVDGTTGIISTVAGTGAQGFSGDGGPAVAAELYQPDSITLDAAGNLFFSDSAYGRIRTINTKTGIITTFAGGGSSLGDGGPAVDASIEYPEGVAFDPAGNLYIGDSFNHRVRVVGAPPVVATLISTTTALTASATSLMAGQSLTLTATVVASSGAMPTGTVQFLNGTVLLGAGTLNAGGVATLTLNPAAGIYSFTADYSGSAANAASHSSPPVTVTVTVTSATVTVLQTSSTALTPGQPLTLTATVTAGSGSVPAGIITFLNGSSALGTASLNSSGTATLTISPPVGSYSITALYAGSATDATSISAPPIVVTVASAPTATHLTVSPNPAGFGSTVTLQSTVTSATGTPTGTVIFYDGPVLLGSGVLASGSGILTVSTLSVGSHNLTAAYPGDADYAPSTSNIVVEVVTPADFSISAAPAARSVYTGESAVYTISIVPQNGFALPVGLACTLLPTNTTCAFSPATVAGGSGIATLTVQTTAPAPTTRADSFKGIGATALAGLVFLCSIRARRKYFMLLVLFVVLTLTVSGGCNNPGELSGGTPVGSQTIEVTVTAANGSQTLSHAATLTLNVKSLF